MSRYQSSDFSARARFAAPVALFAAVAAMLGPAVNGWAASPHSGSVLPASLPILAATGSSALKENLAAVAGKHGTVLLFVSARCPITNQYAPEISRLASHYRAQGVVVLRVYSGVGASAETARAHGAAYGLTGVPALVDTDGTLADAIGASVTPEAFVLDSGRKVRYGGRIDDWFVDRGKSRTSGPSTHDLRAAVDAVLAGKAVPVDRTRAIGCAIERAAVNAVGPTYAHDIAPILQQNCVSCHRAGEIGPMPFETYDQAKQYASNIAAVTSTKQMPPWKPVPGCGAFVGERRLSDAQISLVKYWAESGAPSGDLSTAPAEPAFPKGWMLGQPDMVLKMPSAWKTAGDAKEIYRCFVLPTNLTEARDVVAVEYHPGNRSVVHHIIGYVDTQSRARAMAGKDGMPGYTSFGGPGFMPNGEVGGWAPGNMPAFLPDGIGRHLPAGSDIVLQVHYHPTGKEELDQSEVGLFFAKKPVTKHLRTIPVLANLDIPAGNADYHTSSTFTSPMTAEVIAVTPHMHLLGRKMSMTVKHMDGSMEPLIKIDDWDFNWQGTYVYQKPVHIEKGAVVTLDADYDNSTSNPRNPNSPPRHVGWGEKTTDEMCIGFISFVVENENDSNVKLLDAILGGRQGGGVRRRLAQPAAPAPEPATTPAALAAP